MITSEEAEARAEQRHQTAREERERFAVIQAVVSAQINGWSWRSYLMQLDRALETLLS